MNIRGILDRITITRGYNTEYNIINYKHQFDETIISLINSKEKPGRSCLHKPIARKKIPLPAHAPDYIRK